ncbi:MAG: hypothetical protein LBB65_05795 [Burkholderiales bacterium]|jgi:hypothetical protein|nr:hypothetical protein [Burkholderiales bacterium]
MSQEILDRMMRPEVIVFLFLFATLFLIIAIKSFLYEPRTLLFLFFATGFLGLLKKYGSAPAAMIGFVIEGIAIVIWMLYYGYRERKTPMVRRLGGALLICAAVSILLALR